MTKPSWLRRKIPLPGKSASIRRLEDSLKLHTVCREAHCPNLDECHGQGHAAFLLLGPACTRNCAFCAVAKGRPAVPDPGEPDRVAEAVARLGLSFAVLTMVTRDDLADGGAAHMARAVQAIRCRAPGTGVEVLVSDLNENPDALMSVLSANPEVFNHNLETVPRLSPKIRPQADYDRSLRVITRAADSRADVVIKSGLMLGLGETTSEVHQVLRDLGSAGCRVITLGQYLAPSAAHYPVVRYVPPEEFDDLASEALHLGFAAAASGPYVRSSYNAGHLYRQARINNQTEEDIGISIGS